ncbi:ABC transporter permease [Bacteroidota bacterium]
MIWSIAWKNIWRNKARSMIVIVAFTLGIFGGLFTVASMVGMIQRRIDLAISNELSHIQIHQPEYKDNFELKCTINNYKDIEDSIMKIPEVKGVSSRLKIFAMASTAGSATGVMVNGIDIEDEKNVTNVYEFIKEDGGSFFGIKSKNPIVVGEKLAKTLKLVFYELEEADKNQLKELDFPENILLELDSLTDIKFRTEEDFEESIASLIGEKNAKRYSYALKQQSMKFKLRRKIILQFQDANGDLAYGAFKVIGIYKTSNNMFDGMNVYVEKKDLYTMASVDENKVHEMAIALYDNESINKVSEQVKLIANNYEVETWEEMAPEISSMNQLMDFYLIFFMIIILLALGFGIVNTMLMVILERVKELGMLMAIGMNKKRVFGMIMLETIFLCLVGTAFGMAISYLVIGWTGNTGIDLSRLYGEGFEAMGFSAEFFPTIDLYDFIQVTILVIITGILSAIYPARKALKLNPAEAIRSE